MIETERIPLYLLKDMICPFAIEGTVDLAYCKSFAKGRGCRYLDQTLNNCQYPIRQDK